MTDDHSLNFKARHLVYGAAGLASSASMLSLADGLGAPLPHLALAAAGLVGTLASFSLPLAAKAWTRRVEARLSDETERIESILHAIDDAVIAVDSAGIVEYINVAAERLTGYTLAEAVGLAGNTVLKIHPGRRGEPKGRGLVDNRTTGDRKVVEHSVVAIQNDIGENIGAVYVVHDVTQTQKLAEELVSQASRDALTGLINRREFEVRLRRMLDSVGKRGGSHALLYIDLDQFKVVNDTCGHSAGDELLRQLAKILQGRVRESDTLARLGGDEFGVILDDCPPDKAQFIAAAILEAVRAFRFIWEDKWFQVGASIGLVPVVGQQSFNSLEKLLSAADSVCYAAKDRGRNRVVEYRPEDAEVAQRQGEMQWSPRITKALAEDRFEIHRQPMAHLPLPPNGRPDCGRFEALLRLRDESGDLIPPMAFLPSAERYGLAPKIDRWVISTLLKEERALLYSGETSLCFVNLSAATLTDEEFPAWLKSELAVHNLPGQVLCFEIAESAALANLDNLTRFMKRVHESGCTFALDSFGGGLPSLVRMRGLPVEYLKIQPSLIQSMLTDPIAHATVEAICRVGKVMGVKTIAEAAETPDLVEAVALAGVDYAQGYCLARPAPVCEASEPRPVAAIPTDDPREHQLNHG